MCVAIISILFNNVHNRTGPWGVQGAQWNGTSPRSISKKNYSPVVLLSTTPLKKYSLFSFSLISRVPSSSLHRTFLFFFPDLISFFLFCCLVLDLLELSPLAFGPTQAMFLLKYILFLWFNFVLMV
jgi:hypothetical protein